MPQIALPLEFFVKERNTGYADWRSAFWRELLSNSLDAGATEFHVTDNGAGLITVEDNGKGMPRDICEDVYLSIGRSTKDGDDASVGGFGRARILTCFSMESYEVHGYGYIVKGVGADYEIVEGPSRESGLKLVIQSETHGGWLRFLQTVLQLCDVPDLKIFYNGVQQYFERLRVTETMPMPEFGEAKLLSDKELGAIPAALYSGWVLVRVGGMAMFDAYRDVAGGALVIDLDPKTARDHLTANRDGMRGSGWGPVNTLVEKIKAEGKSAVSTKRKTELSLCGDLSQLRMMSDRAIPQDMLTEQQQLVPIRAAKPGTPITCLTEGYSGTLIGFSINSENETMVRLANMWRPGVQIPAMERFLKAWTEACQIALEALVDWQAELNGYWLPGLTFHDEALATAARIETPRGEVMLLSVNPYNPSTHKLRFKLNTRAGAQALLADAAHEAAHRSAQLHDKNYANALTEIMGRIDLDKFLKLSKEWGA